MSLTESKKKLSVPSTGMRGGLGRRLLTAFLIMAIGPLSVLSWYAARSGRRNIQHQVSTRLTTVATTTERRVRDWAESRRRALAVLGSSPRLRESLVALSQDPTQAESARRYALDHMEAFLETDAAFTGVAFVSCDGQMPVSSGAPLQSEEPSVRLSELGNAGPTVSFTSLDPSSEAGALVAQPVTAATGQRAGSLVGWIELGGLETLLDSVGGLGEGGRLYVVDDTGIALPKGSIVTSEGMAAALSGEAAEGIYENRNGVTVIGVYRRMADLGLVLAAEQPREEALSEADRVTAAIVAAALVVALVTSAIAAIVARQITDPVVRLTEAALHAAEGDLEQQVHVRSRDEIGILASVFNRMMKELGSLYDGLEAKVAERTRLLSEANYTIQRRAVQLATTVKIGRAITSILDPSELLDELVHLVHDQFSYSYVGVYLISEDEKQALLATGTGGGELVEKAKDRPVSLSGEDAVSQAFAHREPVLQMWSEERSRAELSTPHVRAEVALPMAVRGDIVGVLDILTLEPERIDEDTLSILSSVASQVAIALDNARAYRRERAAREELRQANESRSRFLAHMSRELREPLTNIIGFCRLILNGLDGPVTEQQRHDLRIIDANAEHLLGLINDLLDVSQIEAGLMELHFEELDLPAMTKSVMATASALVRGKDIQLRHELEDLPFLRADPARIRRVLLQLLTNAAKSTEEGCITVREWSDGEQVFVSVSDTGTGIPPQDQKRVFEQFERGVMDDGQQLNGAGLGLALSKEFVEMHGGDIWLESEVGKGTTFTFSLPLEPEPCPAPEPNRT